MISEQLETRTAQGERVVIWRSCNDDQTPRPVVVLVPGFGQRMRHLGAIADYFAPPSTGRSN